MLQATSHTSSPERFAEPADRMDGSVEKQINILLHDSEYDALRGVWCKCRDGAWILQGRVSSYFLKQMAHRVASSVDRDLEIRNDVEVRFP